MKTDISFDVDFSYPLSENITIPLTANVQLHHSEPYYLITGFQFKENPDSNPLLSDINIMAIKNDAGISWVHVDSRKETKLSLAVGKAIEAKGAVEFLNKTIKEIFIF